MGIVSRFGYHELAKWFVQREFREHLLDGLQKAGLDLGGLIPDP